MAAVLLFPPFGRVRVGFGYYSTTITAKVRAPMVASTHSKIPVINAGDGGHQHPTQTLTDLLTIRSLKGRLNNFTIGLCGDLKFGRTVHSLINALSRYDNIKFIFVSPEELRIPEYITDNLKEKDIPSMIYYPRGMHQQQAFRNLNLEDADYPNTVEATKRVLSLPMHPYMTKEEVDYICSVITKEIY